jgi:hypothetical protein
MGDTSFQAVIRPLTIYVIFHPRSAESRDLAGHLHDWFRLKFDEGDSTEAGLPIWFRARLRGGAVHPPVAWSEAQLNVVVVLADDQMVADAAWRPALEALTAEADASGSVVLPVPVDVSSFRLRFLFARRNRLHAGEARPDDEPEAPTDPLAREARAQRISSRARILRRGVTEAITRELRRHPPSYVEGPVPALASSLPEPLDVFLSHAKRDGRAIARSLRDGMADFGQMKTWFDENDLPAGYAWASPMVDAAEKQTAALISIVTDAYPTRPWCRREVNVARQPREVDLGLPRNAEGGRGIITAWTVQPAVAVTRGRTSWSRPMAQLAQVPHLGWPDQLGDVGRCIADVVDRLLLEALLVTFYRRLAPVLARQHANGSRNIAFLTWVPDPWSVAHVRGALLERDPSRRWILAYPGHGLRSAERRELELLLRSMETGRREPQFVLATQERLHEVEGSGASEPLRVVLSGGGRPEDVEPAGIGVEHLNDLMVRLTRRLLERGHRVAYGGSLSDYRANLTKAIIATAQGWDRITDDDAASRLPVASSAKELETPPLVNYAAWPFYAHITPRQRAELTGICHFINVDPVDEPPIAAKDARDSEPEHARMMADALTRMRRLATQEGHVRIVMGGSIRGWRGWIPGIVEEVLCSYEQGQPCLIIGGFGGCAGELASFLLDAARPWPEALTLADAEAKDAPFRILLRSPGARDEAVNRFAAAQTSFELFRRQLHGDEPWPAAVPRELFRRLLTSASPSSAIDLALRALEAFADRKLRGDE